MADKFALAMGSQIPMGKEIEAILELETKWPGLKREEAAAFFIEGLLGRQAIP
jgi:hypothetical protein